MFKPEKEFAREQLQSIVDNYNFFVYSMHYYYSDVQMLTDNLQRGVLPETSVDLKTLQTRYQIFDSMGRLYAHDVTTAELRKSILAVSYQVLDFEQPYLHGLDFANQSGSTTRL